MELPLLHLWEKENRGPKGGRCYRGSRPLRLPLAVDTGYGWPPGAMMVGLREPWLSVGSRPAVAGVGQEEGARGQEFVLDFPALLLP